MNYFGGSVKFIGVWCVQEIGTSQRLGMQVLSPYAPATPCPVLTWHMSLCPACAVTGTDVVYIHMPHLYRVRYRHRICPYGTERILVPALEAPVVLI